MCVIPCVANVGGSGKAYPIAVRWTGSEDEAEGREIKMAKVIEFYVPGNFRTRELQRATEDRGEVIAFRPRIADTVRTNEWDAPCAVQPAVVEIPRR